MSTRVFVRLYDGISQYETEDEVLELPLPPLKWKDVITAIVAAVGKQDEHVDGVTMPKARLFLLPTEIEGITAELNARSLRFGVRENDRFVICLRGEDYQQPSERQSSAEPQFAAAVGTLSARSVTLSTPSSSNGTIQPSISPYANGQIVGETSITAPIGNIGRPPKGGVEGGHSSGSLIVNGKKGSKRYRSISGKMAAIKSLGDMGLISKEDRGHLKDLLLNSDSPQLQEALDKYNNTGDFQAVKDLLLKEAQSPPLKRNTTDWLSESFVHDIALNFNTTPPVMKTEPIQTQQISNQGRFDPAPPTERSSSVNTYKYQTTSQSTPMNSTGYLQSSSMATNHYLATESLVAPTGGNLSVSNGYTAGMLVSSIYHPTTVMPQLYHQPQVSLANSMYGAAPQINLPLRDRATYMKRGYESSPAHNMSITPPALSSGMSAQAGMNGYVLQQGYMMNQVSYPANIIYAGDQTQYSSMNPYMAGSNGVYNPYLQQSHYAMNRYGYGSLHPDMGYNFYAAGYGCDKTQLRAGAGGKWTTAPPMPSYPPPCSKEEKKEKIAKWLKKRENRNWSNKPSYPVRHSIAKNRKRGEDGRFITKTRLAEMAAEEAAAAAVLKNSIEPQKTSLPSPTSEGATISIASQIAIPQATSVP